MRELLGVVAESVLDELVDAIATQSAERALGLVHRLIADGQNLQHFCREAIRHFRNLLVARVCGADSDLVAAPADERPRLAEQAAQFSEEDLTRFFNILLATDDDLRRKPDPRLHLELGLLKLVNAQRLAPLEEVLAELRGEGGPAKSQASASGTPPRAMSAAQSASAPSYSAAVAAGVETPKASAPFAAGSCRFAPVRAASPVSAGPVPASPSRVVARAAKMRQADWHRRRWRRSKRRCKVRSFCGPWSSTPRAGKSKAVSCGFSFRPRAARSRKCCRRATRWNDCAQC